MREKHFQFFNFSQFFSGFERQTKGKRGWQKQLLFKRSGGRRRFTLQCNATLAPSCTHAAGHSSRQIST
jgi:hypothetical protein